jgi:hypothetical protein
MKKLFKEQIDEKFKKVTDQYFDFFDGMHLIKLDGKFASDELRSIADVMDEVFHGSREVNRIQKLKIFGFIAKDIKVTYFTRYGGWRYSFYIMKDGKDWDFYYGKSDQGAGDWWPDSKDEYDVSPIHQFIPSGFAESCENMYEYHKGSHKEALELLKDCGFTIERGEDY